VLAPLTAVKNNVGQFI